MIGIIQWHGKEYRLATYLGAKVLKIKEGEIVIRQGSLVLTVRLIERHALSLGTHAIRSKEEMRQYVKKNMTTY